MKSRNLRVAIAAASLLGLGAAGTAQAGHPDVSVQLSWGIPAYHAYHYGYAPIVVAPPYGQFSYYHSDGYPGGRGHNAGHDGRRYGHGYGHNARGGGHYDGRQSAHAQDNRGGGRHGRDGR